MKLKQNKKVVFEPLTHTYLCGETILKGVTTLMKEQGLSPDYSAIPQEVLMKAAEHGTAIHQLLEDYDNGEPVVLTDEVADYPKLGLHVIQSEYLVSDNKAVASMIDKVIFVDEQTVDLADVKTTSSLHTESISWQLSIYKHLFEKQNKGVKVRNLYGIHVRNNKVKLVKIEEIPGTEVKKLLECNAKGETYDSNGVQADTPDASLVLSDAALLSLVSNNLRLIELKEAVKHCEELISQYTERMVAYMKENHLTEMAAAGGTFKLKDEYTRETLDSKAIKKDYPELYDEYKRTSTVKASITFKAN